MRTDGEGVVGGDGVDNRELGVGVVGIVDKVLVVNKVLIVDKVFVADRVLIVDRVLVVGKELVVSREEGVVGWELVTSGELVVGGEDVAGGGCNEMTKVKNGSSSTISNRLCISSSLGLQATNVTLVRGNKAQENEY